MNKATDIKASMAELEAADLARIAALTPEQRAERYGAERPQSRGPIPTVRPEAGKHFDSYTTDDLQQARELQAAQERGADAVVKVPEFTAKDAVGEDTELAELVRWLSEQTWSSFAVSLTQQVGGGKALSPKQLDAARSMKAKTQAKDAERKAQDAAKATGLDISQIPSGIYAVPGGDTRLKVRIRQVDKEGKWQGWTFVDDGAAYGQGRRYGRQAPGGTYSGDIEQALATIAANPKEAAREYGRLTGKCCICNRQLEDEQSVAKGIGPICEGKF